MVTSSTSALKGSTATSSKSVNHHENGGRERAIEALYDRDPQGSVYTAARVVANSIPSALRDRPNLISKSSLVEQALSLSLYAIDSVEKYDEAYSCDNNLRLQFSNEEPIVTDARTKERILNYQARVTAKKQCSISLGDKVGNDVKSESQTILLNENDSSNSMQGIRVCGSPASSFVAALRQIYSDNLGTSSSVSSSFDIRRFLQSVANHAIFMSPELLDGNNISDTHTKSNDTSQANLEQLVVQLVNLSDKEPRVQMEGLLITILSVLTRKQQPCILEGVENSDVSPIDTPCFSSRTIDSDGDDPLQQALQIGVVLSLLPIGQLGQEDSQDSGNISISTTSQIDPSMLNYFGAAAAIYEERLEILNEHQVSVAAVSPSTPFSPLTQDETKNKVTDHNDSDGIESIGLFRQHSFGTLVKLASQHVSSPPNWDSKSESSKGNGNDGVKIEEQIHDDQNIEEQRNEEPNAEELINREKDEEECDDDDGDDDDDDDESSSESAVDSIATPTPESRNVIRNEDHSLEEGYQHHLPEQSDDDDVIENGESSSSSSSDSSDVDEVASDPDIDTDDEDDAVLSQALALSMETEGKNEKNNSPLLSRASEDQGTLSHTDPHATDETTLRKDLSDTALSNQNSVAANSSCDDVESSLPQFPKVPQSNWFKIIKHFNVNALDVLDDPDAKSRVPSASIAECDPIHEKFGLIPDPFVLLHLMHCTRQLSEKLIYSNLPTTGISSAKAIDQMGSTTFTSHISDSEPQNAKEKIAPCDFASSVLTLQLHFACFLLIQEKRSSCLQSLRELLVKEQQSSSGAEITHAVDDVTASGEEDDPALNLAMNYVEDETFLLSEALGNKGMMRKAAAAAHDQSTLLKLLKKRKSALTTIVKVYSVCLVHCMTSIRVFLQSHVRYAIIKSTLPSSSNTDSLISKFSNYFPCGVMRKFTSILEDLSSPISVLSRIDFVDANSLDRSDVCEDLALYKESILLWGECIPLLYPSTSKQVDLLVSLKKKCADLKINEYSVHSTYVADIAKLPGSVAETALHKLQIMCRRLRVIDALSRFVSKPILFNPDDDEKALQNENQEHDDSSLHSMQPCLASSIISKLVSSLGGCSRADVNLKHFLMALCHRCHVNALLLDTFSVTAEADAEESRNLAPAKLLENGDTLRVNVNASNGLSFDSTKCSESIAMITSDNYSSLKVSEAGSSVHQRASKVWGTVLACQHFRPKTGLHRWAVRLDKCERGHVFLGVATAQASTRTYVGGDKYGWGMIGTQALWHDRRKIRGDYGSTFRTGSTIIVALDTDAGTLSFSCWEENSPGASVNPTVGTPQTRGTIEDWGIAFEGLPLDAKFFPAVGLYQRDDRVTIFPVESLSDLSITGGECYYPSCENNLSNSITRDRVRLFNDQLTCDGITYASDLLSLSLTHLEHDKFFLTQILPSLSAVLCLLPQSIPIISSRYAVWLMPRMTECIRKLDQMNIQSGERSKFPIKFDEGPWIVRAYDKFPCTDSDEYEIVIQNSTNDDTYGSCLVGQGKTSIDEKRVISLSGSLDGTLLNFTEEWSDETSDKSTTSKEDVSKCYVSARISLDGRRFDGKYRNTKFGTTGQIIGHRKIQQQEQMLSISPGSCTSEIKRSVQLCSILLCMAQTHLASIFIEDLAGDLGKTARQPGNSVDSSNPSSTGESNSNKFLSKSCCYLDEASLRKEVDSLSSMYRMQVVLPNRTSYSGSNVFESVLIEGISAARSYTISDIFEKVSFVDMNMTGMSGGMGSFRCLGGANYKNARLNIICSLIHYFHLVDKLNHVFESFSTSDELIAIWRLALRVMEDKIRNSLSVSGDRNKRECCIEVCNLHSRIATFLFDLVPDALETRTCLREDDLFDVIEFFRIINKDSDISTCRDEMLLATKRGIMRLSAFTEVWRLLTELQPSSVFAIESLMIQLPRQLTRQKHSPGKGSFSKGEDIELDFKYKYYGDYTYGLNCCCVEVRLSLHKMLDRIFQNLTQIAEGVLTKTLETKVLLHSHAVSSFLLGLLAAFLGACKIVDLDHLRMGRRMLRLLPTIIKTYRSSAINNIGLHSDANFGCAFSVSEIWHADLSRSVLKSAVAAAHVMIYQATLTVPEDPDEIDARKTCLSFLKSELEITIDHVLTSSSKNLKQISVNVKDEEWQRWGNAFCSDHTIVPMTRHESKKSSILNYLRNVDHVNSSVTKSSNSKESSSAKSPSTGVDRLYPESLSIEGFGEQMLSNWLHAVCAVLRSPELLKVLSLDHQWIKMLFSAIGLDSEGRDGEEVVQWVPRKLDNQLLPVRFRLRILRLLPPLLLTLEASNVVIEGLLYLTGLSSPLSMVYQLDEDGAISRECISVLRLLYLPSNSAWRRCFCETLSSVLRKEDNKESTLYQKIGILHVFGGSVGSVSIGSHVLVKPAAAVSLLSDHQQLSTSKSNSAMAGGSLSSAMMCITPHHLAGTGTEAVLTGLCRDSASAGIVSSIDIKNGMCEIVMVNRDREEAAESNLLREQNHGIAGINESSHRQALTVRSLRTPLTGINLAQEVPLVLDHSFPCKEFAEGMLLTSLKSLHESMKEVSSIDERKVITAPPLNCVKIVMDTMVLKCFIVLMSDEILSSNFLSLGCAREILSSILRLAWPTEIYLSEDPGFVSSTQIKSIASLPVHEAKLSYLLSMLRSLKSRIVLFDDVSPSEWTEKLDLFRERQAKNVIEKPINDFKNDVETVTVVLGTKKASERLSENTREIESTSNRSVSQSTGGSNSDDEEDSEAASHLREAAIAQMAELGLPRSWAELALRRTGGINIEAAVTFCLERSGEIERLIADERERDRLLQTSMGQSLRSGNRNNGPSSHLLRQLLEMGFSRRWCSEALAVTGNNVDEALTWILNNGERLSEEDEAIEAEAEISAEVDEDDDSADGDEEDDTEAGENNDEIEVSNSEGKCENERQDRSVLESNEEVIGWTGSVTPLSFISGRATVDTKKMEIAGLPTGGFSSVGTKGILLTTGKWYYEAVLETAGCLQIGWADGSFAGHCHADRGDGCGDGPSSWAFDGWRRYRWHATATEWGCRWKDGDVVGCMVDMDERTVSFTLNGEDESIGMGLAFSGAGFRPCGGVYACVSFNRREKLRLILGGPCSESFKYRAPVGYRGVGEAVIDAVKELDVLVEKESALEGLASFNDDVPKRFLCDFSDGEHGHELIAWAHRYYGSDASVHLGSGRSKQNSGKVSNAPAASFNPSPFLEQRIQKEWVEQFNINTEPLLDVEAFTTSLRSGHSEVEKKIVCDMQNECSIFAIILCRKVLLHMLIVLGDEFKLSIFSKGAEDENSVFCRFWKVIEVCTSLQSAGWVGEAGAMALAAEALGLGISSNEQMNSRSNLERSGVVSATELDEGLFIPICGFSQLLTSVLRFDIAERDTRLLSPACAEASMGGEGGSGILSFLQDGLRSACSRSLGFRQVLLAAIRRYIRLLAVVEYDGNVVDSLDNQGDTESTSVAKSPLGRSPTSQLVEKMATNALPDARLASFLTGLLLSTSFSGDNGSIENEAGELVEAWSLGLLSASLPWRMVCSFTVAGMLSLRPHTFSFVLQSCPAIINYFGRLPSAVSRRLWAERAALPVCSRYSQSLVELYLSVKRCISGIQSHPAIFTLLWNRIDVDASAPLPRIKPFNERTPEYFWETAEGWISGDAGWELWSGFVDYAAVEWKTPSRSSVRTLMDGGDGPPLLGIGCIVIRGGDWDNFHGSGDTMNEDGKDLFDNEKMKRDKVKHQSEDTSTCKDNLVVEDPELEALPHKEKDSQNYVEELVDNCCQDENGVTQAKKNKNKTPSPKLPLGTVISIEPWKGVPGMGRRVRWHLTGTESVYRYGGDGGRFDLCHVEVNSKQTRIKRRHPPPESSEQCVSRHGFGVSKRFPVLLRLMKLSDRGVCESEECIREGILEWPDFGAAVKVTCSVHQNKDVTITENELIFGSKDSGWEARFGQPSFTSGTRTVLSPAVDLSESYSDDRNMSLPTHFEELIGSSVYDVDVLRNPEDGSKLAVTSTMHLVRSHSFKPSYISNANISSLPPPLKFDRSFLSSSLCLSKDGRTVSCSSSDGRGSAFMAMGFTKGVHYWEVKLEQADIGSVFIGVAEKPCGSGSGSSFVHDTPPRLNKWHGWGFVNYRATYASGAERVYGSHCHAGDTVGVLLDCDGGRLSFFFDGLKYGEHILNDLGCAFENLSPFGFNVDGCGSGGVGQGAPSGFENGPSGRYPAQGTIKPRTLWPVVGLKNQGDRVTISSKWNSSYGVDGPTFLNNISAVSSLIDTYSELSCEKGASKNGKFPEWFIAESFVEYNRWRKQTWTRTISRGSSPHRLASFGLDLDLDSSPYACAAACSLLGLDIVLLAGDRVRLKRSAGRILELAEEAEVLGAFQGRLYYKIVSQKSEGGSLTEGGDRAWCWDESEVVDGIQLLSPDRTFNCKLPKLNCFKCTYPGGLRVVYENGAVVRSDIEIFEGSKSLGTIPVGKLIPRCDVIERRMNSCGVARFRVRYDGIGEGWISARIRGGTEEAIVEGLNASDDAVDNDIIDSPSYGTPADSASEWFDCWQNRNQNNVMLDVSGFHVETQSEFEELISDGVISGLDALQSDIVLAATINAISNTLGTGDALACSFHEVTSVLSYALSACSSTQCLLLEGNKTAEEAAASLFVGLNVDESKLQPLLARMAFLRALNRRAKYALPWLSVRPAQEGSALFGGISGHGASGNRVGRSRLSQPENVWVQIPCIASRIREFRKVLFTSVKIEILQSLTDATTTPTPLSHDEYVLPREIRTVRINRLKAGRVMLGDDVTTKRKHSVFAQLRNETRSWGGASLRRGFVAKGHGGQRRAFEVKLIGEGVNDYSGPYREVFTDAFSEILMFDDKGDGALGVLEPTPNTLVATGENQGLFMFSLNGRESTHHPFLQKKLSLIEEKVRMSFASLTIPRDEPTLEVEEALVFLGRLAGTAFRHRIAVDLPLGLSSVWNLLAEDENSANERLRELDHLALRHHEGDSRTHPLLSWQHKMLNSFAEGLSHVLPLEMFALLTGTELRDALCGNPEVDVAVLKQVVEYEGYESTDCVIGYFWDTLLSMSNQDRKKFLQFVWARNRLPARPADFESPFKIQRDTLNSGEKSDQALPSASTCFFSLKLPEYSSAEILREKLLMAITNVTTMETDFQTNSAEIAEGYKAF